LALWGSEDAIQARPGVVDIDPRSIGAALGEAFMKLLLAPLSAAVILAAVPVCAQDVASLSNSSREPAQSAPSDYRIGPQDILQIDVFDAPDLSRTDEVDSSGFVAVPLIGEIAASGQTPNELAQDIAAELGKKYLRDPIVTVTVKNAASQKVTVDGSVIQPGIYPIGPGTTLLQAVALAKGPDTVADAHHVALIRKGAGGQSVLVFDLEDIRAGKAPDPFVRANDVIVVDVSGIRRFVRDFGSLFGFMAFLRP
jgi:polysaccharide biosynthesis/export protein